MTAVILWLHFCNWIRQFEECNINVMFFHHCRNFGIFCLNIIWDDWYPLLHTICIAYVAFETNPCLSSLACAFNSLAHRIFQWNFRYQGNWRSTSSMEFPGIPWNCSCHQNWRTSSSMEFHGIPWNCSCNRNWRTPSSMEFHGIFFFCYLMEPLASSILWVLNLDRITRNFSFQIVMEIISTFAEWIHFRKLISTLYRFVSLFHQLMFYYQSLHYTICIFGITHYVSKYHSKSLFNAHWNLFWS